MVKICVIASLPRADLSSPSLRVKDSHFSGPHTKPGLSDNTEWLKLDPPRFAPVRLDFSFTSDNSYLPIQHAPSWHHSNPPPSNSFLPRRSLPDKSRPRRSTRTSAPSCSASAGVLPSVNGHPPVGPAQRPPPLPASGSLTSSCRAINLGAAKNVRLISYYNLRFFFWTTLKSR